MEKHFQDYVNIILKMHFWNACFLEKVIMNYVSIILERLFWMWYFSVSYKFNNLKSIGDFLNYVLWRMFKINNHMDRSIRQQNA